MIKQDDFWIVKIGKEGLAVNTFEHPGTYNRFPTSDEIEISLSSEGETRIGFHFIRYGQPLGYGSNRRAAEATGLQLGRYSLQ